jgi:hypothetical protein
MRIAFVRVFASTLFFLFLGLQAVSAQVSQDADKKQESPSSAQAAPEEKKEAPVITIELVGGGRLQVEELRETRDGIWYRRGGVTTLLDATRVARIEAEAGGQ